MVVIMLEMKAEIKEVINIVTSVSIEKILNIKGKN